MKFPRFVLATVLTSSLALSANAQSSKPETTPARKPSSEQTAFQKGTFTGATADKSHYHVVYHLDSDDPKLIKMTLRNMKNALEDPRLKGKLEMQLVAYAGGVNVFRKDQAYEPELQALKAQGVILTQCLNTMKERNISKEELFPFISYVPTGNGELIIRQAQGWALVHP
ncbi:DsrE family protein [Hymenobacter sp. BT188]|uniref:DsrE family protein n=1 Tax=Hymenobacter sp. BT188 TaxID=2763504 RepID=UPI001650EDC7|nr:DsrE family protein [Hymenobacter sp. BT188]MBC6609265.1 DsrE family protein [Hymenobacter sp. BT188]